MTLGPLYCAECGGTELTRAKKPRCARCESKRIQTKGTIRDAVVGYYRGEITRPGEAVKRWLREIGASWP